MAISTWKYGLPNTNNGNLYRGYDTNPGGDIEGWFWYMTKWNVTPGQKTITNVAGRTAFASNVSETRVTVLSGSGTTKTIEGSDIVSPTFASDSTTAWSESCDLTVTIVDGTDYWIAVAMKRPASDGSGQPGHRGVSSALSSNDTYFLSLSGASFPSSVDTTAGSDPLNNTDLCCIEITYTANEDVQFSESSPHTSGTTSYLIPVCTSSDYMCIKQTDAVVATNKAIQYDLEEVSGATWQSVQTAIRDHLSGGNKMTFNGNDVSLNTESGQIFDLMLNINNTGGAKFLWINKTSGQGSIAGGDDHNTISHNAKRTSARGTYEGSGDPRVLTLFSSASVTLGKLEVGINPILFQGDSQIASKSPLQANSGRILDEITTLWDNNETPHIWWINGEGSGGQMKDDTSATAGTLTQFDVSDTNIGVYDGNEVDGAIRLVLTAINDFASDITSLLTTMQSIAGQALAHNQKIIFCDVPPAWSAAFSSSESEAIKNHSDDVISMNGYNAAVYGIEASWRYFTRSINSSNIYEGKREGTWFNTDKIHYLSAGGIEKATLIDNVINDGGLIITYHKTLFSPNF